MEVERYENRQHFSNTGTGTGTGTDSYSHSHHNSDNLHHKIPPCNTNFTQSSESKPKPDYQNQVVNAVFGESSSENEQEHQNEDCCSDCLDEYQKQMIKNVFGDSSSESEQEDENKGSGSDCFDEYQKQMIKDVFGDSSSESESEDYRNPNHHWSKVEGITGLWLCSCFLSPRHQSRLLRYIEGEGWFKEGAQNQAMRFGDLPFWAVDLSSDIREVIRTGDLESDIKMLNHRNNACVFPSHLLSRIPFFDQLIVNVYQPGEGICAHVDLMRFEDGIAIVSLESPCVMHFSPVGKDDEEEVPLETKVPVYLIPGSLVLMSGEARYKWKHEINRKPGIQIWEGQEIVQKKRTSITLRKLCVSE